MSAAAQKPARRRRKPAKPPSCVLCSKPLDTKSTSFTLGNSKPLVHACEEHAPVIRAGVASTAKLAAVGVKTLINIRFPGLLDALGHIGAAARSISK